MQKLIFDLGFHNGDSSLSYLKKGFKVIGVECNPNLKTHNNEEYEKYIADGYLTLLDYCISDKDNEIIPFYISTCSVWCSANINIAERFNDSEQIEVETITLSSLIDNYGCPDYCKIDIEGNDVLAVRSLKDAENIPNYISVEAECLGKNEAVTVNLVDELYNVGYKEFFFVRQSPGYNMFFDFNEEYEWLSYDDAKKQLIELQEEKWDWGVWADIYAKK